VPLPAESIAQEAALRTGLLRPVTEQETPPLSGTSMNDMNFWHSVPTWLDTDQLAEVRAYATGPHAARTACLTVSRKHTKKP
jgi:hypothetical protein